MNKKHIPTVLLNHNPFSSRQQLASAEAQSAIAEAEGLALLDKAFQQALFLGIGESASRKILSSSSEYFKTVEKGNGGYVLGLEEAEGLNNIKRLAQSAFTRSEEIRINAAEAYIATNGHLHNYGREKALLGLEQYQFRFSSPTGRILNREEIVEKCFTAEKYRAYGADNLDMAGAEVLEINFRDIFEFGVKREIALLIEAKDQPGKYVVVFIPLTANPAKKGSELIRAAVLAIKGYLGAEVPTERIQEIVDRNVRLYYPHYEA